MKKRIQDMDVRNKTVLLRCDFNVPVSNGAIIDDSKIVESLETIEYLIKNNAKIVILSHFGKVKKEEDKKKNTLEPVAKHLQTLITTKVMFSRQTRSTQLKLLVEKMNPGEILVLENTRFEDVPNKLESGNDPQLAMYWAGLADIFCLDAFGSSHRKHASTFGVAKYIPSCIGFLVQKEVINLDKYVLNAEKPFTILMGGAKVEDKVGLIEALLPKCDHLLLTGGIANSCLYTLGYMVGQSLKTEDENVLEKLKSLLVEYQEKIMLPLDVIVGSSYDNNLVKHIKVDEVLAEQSIMDIGMDTVRAYADVLNKSATIFVNGTAGKYEEKQFATGTRELLGEIANNNAIKIVGGGDGVSAVKHFHLEEKFTYLSTGGGATLEYIINGGLPAIDNIEEQ